MSQFLLFFWWQMLSFQKGFFLTHFMWVLVRLFFFFSQNDVFTFFSWIYLKAEKSLIFRCIDKLLCSCCLQCCTVINVVIYKPSGWEKHLCVRVCVWQQAIVWLRMLQVCMFHFYFLCVCSWMCEALSLSYDIYCNLCSRRGGGVWMSTGLSVALFVLFPIISVHMRDLMWCAF